MSTRRDFIKNASKASALAVLPTNIWKGTFDLNHTVKADQKIWASLIHLSFNMWEDHNDLIDHPTNINLRARVFDPNLRLDEALWNDVLLKMKQSGMNMILIDVGDGIQYQSHPEISVKGAWSHEKLRAELRKIREMGIEPIPKLNFSTGHDAWLGEYSKMVSTPKYYDVCKNVINEVVDLFDKPRFFHIGFDEEDYENQKYYNHIVLRNNDAWWKDFYFFVDEVEKAGSRSWIWSDMAWHYPDIFFNKMPKSVLQSNWYYGSDFKDTSFIRVKNYLELEKHGYDQIPCSGYYQGHDAKHYSETGISGTVEFCKKHIDDKRLFGFMQTNWRPVVESFRKDIMRSIELTGEAKKLYSKI